MNFPQNTEKINTTEEKKQQPPYLVRLREIKNPLHFMKRVLKNNFHLLFSWKNEGAASAATASWGFRTATAGASIVITVIATVIVGV